MAKYYWNKYYLKDEVKVRTSYGGRDSKRCDKETYPHESYILTISGTQISAVGGHNTLDDDRDYREVSYPYYVNIEDSRTGSLKSKIIQVISGKVETEYVGGSYAGEYYYYSYNYLSPYREKTKGSLICIVSSENPNEYPSNGDKNGYWYSKIDEVPPINYGNYVWNRYEVKTIMGKRLYGTTDFIDVGTSSLYAFTDYSITQQGLFCTSSSLFKILDRDKFEGIKSCNGYIVSPILYGSSFYTDPVLENLGVMGKYLYQVIQGNSYVKNHYHRLECKCNIYTTTSNKVKGSLVDRVYSNARTQYPDNGISGDFYYEYVGESKKIQIKDSKSIYNIVNSNISKDKIGKTSLKLNNQLYTVEGFD